MVNISTALKYALFISLAWQSSNLDPTKINNKLSIYTYPEDYDSFPNEFYQGFSQSQIIPKEIIVKVMDMGEDMTIYNKYGLYEGMAQKFNPNQFDLTWMLNISPDLKLTEDHAKQVLDFLSKLMASKSRPNFISIDAEPIIDSKGGNLLPFHAKLISGINSWNVPVSVYVNPSVWNNPDIDLNNKAGLNNFYQFLRMNPENIVYLPAYIGADDNVRIDRLRATCRIFEERGIKYKPIIDIGIEDINIQILEQRLKDLSESNLMKNGLAIYRLDRKVKAIKPNIEALIRKYYIPKLSFLE
jgi:hypothetical protein